MTGEAAAKESYPHVVIVPGVAAAIPVIEGSRIPVSTLVRAHRLGVDFDEILVQYPTVRPEDLHGAFVYYFDHKPQIDAIMERAEQPIPGATVVKV
jgi:uncharacterized protein (DUF433 family)